MTPLNVARTVERASAVIAAARRNRPRRGARAVGLAAFETAPCYRETVEREEREERA
jgi:hypothetical protein